MVLSSFPPPCGWVTALTWIPGCPPAPHPTVWQPLCCPAESCNGFSWPWCRVGAPSAGVKHHTQSGPCSSPGPLSGRMRATSLSLFTKKSQWGSPRQGLGEWMVTMRTPRWRVLQGRSGDRTVLIWCLLGATVTVTYRASKRVSSPPASAGPGVAPMQPGGRPWPGLAGKGPDPLSPIPSCSQGSSFCHLPECCGGEWSGQASPQVPWN